MPQVIKLIIKQELVH